MQWVISLIMCVVAGSGYSKHDDPFAGLGCKTLQSTGQTSSSDANLEL